jgi:hypothetical protein
MTIAVHYEEVATGGLIRKEVATLNATLDRLYTNYQSKIGPWHTPQTNGTPQAIARRRSSEILS